MVEIPAVLYVDDDAGSREVMDLLLRYTLGFEHVTILDDSTHFVTVLRSLHPHPDIVLLDIHVQPYDGFTMLRMLREIEAFRDTPVVALTASVMNEEVQQLKSAGFRGVIAKPVDIDGFDATLKQFLRGESSWNISHV